MTASTGQKSESSQGLSSRTGTLRSNPNGENGSFKRISRFEEYNDARHGFNRDRGHEPCHTNGISGNGRKGEANQKEERFSIMNEAINSRIFGSPPSAAGVTTTDVLQPRNTIPSHSDLKPSPPQQNIQLMGIPAYRIAENHLNTTFSASDLPLPLYSSRKSKKAKKRPK